MARKIRKIWTMAFGTFSFLAFCLLTLQVEYTSGGDYFKLNELFKNKSFLQSQKCLIHSEKKKTNYKDSADLMEVGRHVSNNMSARSKLTACDFHAMNARIHLYVFHMSVIFLSNYSSIQVSQCTMPVSTQPGGGTAKCNAAIIHVINHSCVVPA